MRVSSKVLTPFSIDVDSVIEVPEKGKALQYWRFNAGVKMKIF